MVPDNKLAGGGKARKVAIAVLPVNESKFSCHRLRSCLVLIVARRGESMAVRAMLLILGAFHAGNGLWMLFAPEAWYLAIPGVSTTGPFNHHFVADTALAFIASGVGLILGATRRPWAATAAIAGAVWPGLHALFHVWIWLSMGVPQTMAPFLSEVFGVFAVGALGASLGFMRARQGGIA
jgi:hypothetical protein